MEWLFFSFLFLPVLLSFLCAWCREELALWSLSLLGAVAMLGLNFTLLWDMIRNDRTISLYLPLFRQEGVVFQLNSLGLVLSTLACVMWMVSVVTGREYFVRKKMGRLTLYYCALWLVLTGCLGVFFAQDLFTFFIFFELMSFVSTAWVSQDSSREGLKATLSYLAYGILGGMSILTGLFLLSAFSPDLPLSPVQHYPEGFHRFLGTLLLLLGFCAKAGLFFLHDWLPLAHTASPAPVSGLLSGLLTKTGVLGALIVLVNLMPTSRNFAFFMLIFATITLFLGAVCGFLSGNLKRVLAYSTVSQIGFLLWGVALIAMLDHHSAVAIYGLVFHLVNHGLVKILLFSLAGVAYQCTGSLELKDLRGFGQGKPWFHLLFVVGAWSLSGLPLGAAYASKTLLHEALADYMHYVNDAWFYHCFEWVFTLTGGITMAYLFRIYRCLFWDIPKKPWPTQIYASKKSLCCLSLVGVCLVFLGAFPVELGLGLGDFVATHFRVQRLNPLGFYSLSHLKYAGLSLFFALALLEQRGRVCRMKELDMLEEHDFLRDSFQEKLYRPFFSLLALFFGVIARILDVAVDVFASYLWQWGCKPLKIPDSFYHGEKNKRKYQLTQFHLSYSLSYSLLMFGMGFMITIVYLLVVGGS